MSEAGQPVSDDDAPLPWDGRRRFEAFNNAIRHAEQASRRLVSGAPGEASEHALTSLAWSAVARLL